VRDPCSYESLKGNGLKRSQRMAECSVQIASYGDSTKPVGSLLYTGDRLKGNDLKADMDPSPRQTPGIRDFRKKAEC
jgi:hypothetical protein